MAVNKDKLRRHTEEIAILVVAGVVSTVIAQFILAKWNMQILEKQMQGLREELRLNQQ